MSDVLRRGASFLAVALVVSACTSGSTLASPSASSAVSADAGSPAATVSTLGRGERVLNAGTYRLDLNQLAGGGTEFPPILVTVPDGWNSLDGWVVNRPRSGEGVPPVAVQFWDVDEVYGHPCQWDGTLFQPGPTVDELAAALVDIPLRSATQPIDVTLDGFAGKYLEWSVPVEIEMDEQGDFPDCGLTDDGHRDLRSWTGKGWASTRYHQGPGQVDRLWILDLDSARLVIDAFYMPSATSAEREELTDVVESITFQR